MHEPTLVFEVADKPTAPGGEGEERAGGGAEGESSDVGNGDEALEPVGEGRKGSPKEGLSSTDTDKGQQCDDDGSSVMMTAR